MLMKHNSVRQKDSTLDLKTFEVIYSLFFVLVYFY